MVSCALVTGTGGINENSFVFVSAAAAAHGVCNVIYTTLYTVNVHFVKNHARRRTYDTIIIIIIFF